jgi:hypothetical protein
MFHPVGNQTHIVLITMPAVTAILMDWRDNGLYGRDFDPVIDSMQMLFFLTDPAAAVMADRGPASRIPSYPADLISGMSLSNMRASNISLIDP